MNCKHYEGSANIQKQKKIKMQIQTSWHIFTKSVHNTFLQHHLHIISLYHSTVLRYTTELMNVVKYITFEYTRTIPASYIIDSAISD